ncbi:MAG: hypothetical protein IPM37_09195 [Hahellaceae bacterium]|nr:hypothetical protein [Hahellaceae bacterium]
MKGLNKILLVAAIAAPFAAQAELKSIDDAAMSDVSGQSGLVIEAGFGQVNRGAAGIYATDWSQAGITIEAFKWEVDTQSWNNETNIVDMAAPVAGAGTTTLAGFIAKDIKIAGKVDVTIDAVADTIFKLVGASGAATLLASDPTSLQRAGGVGITFSGSDINFRVGDMGVYLAGVGQTSSFGAIEILNMNVDGLQLVVRGNGI